MPRRLGLVAILLLSCAGFGRAQTAEDIVAKTIAAQHLDKLKAVQTRRLTGSMSILPMGIDAPVVFESKRPNKVRVTVTVQGTDNIEAYDGETAWALAPAQGKPTAAPVPAEEARSLRQQSDFDGELVDYKAKGHTVELVGKEPVEGTEAFKLKVTLKDGDVQYQYIDAERYLPIKVQATRMMGGSPVTGETFFSDFKDEGGMMVPHTIETKLVIQGTPYSQKVVVQKIEFNVSIDDTRFKMPVEIKK